MKNDIEELYERIKEELNDNEKNNSGLYIYTSNGFVEYKTNYNKDTLSIRIKIKENRRKNILLILEKLKLSYRITNDNKYCVVIEINKNRNYIILDYVVNSHITIPNSFLEHFGYRTNEGMKVDYIDIKDKKIKSQKTKKYKTQYGYYSKLTEDILNINFETKIAMITKKIHDFRNRKNPRVSFTKEEIEDIYNFFDVTTYRNTKMLEQVNEKSVASKIIGDMTHDQFMSFIFTRNFPHVYKRMKFNIVINKTQRDFIINDSMISPILCDNGNEIIIMPINKKESLALLSEEYYKKYYINEELYFMNIENEEDVEMINRHIYKSAKKNSENIIGTKYELEVLLKQES